MKNHQLVREVCILALWSTLTLGVHGAQESAAIPQGGTMPQAAVLRLIRFSGQARGVDGKPLAGVAELTFSLYAEEAGSEPLWFETQTLELDAQGRYTALLGAMHPDGLPLDLFINGQARWLGVSVGRLPEQPRALLVSVPYALKAADAETLGGKPATAFALAPTETGPEQTTTGAKGSVRELADTKKMQSRTGTTGAAATAPATNYIPVFTDNAGTLGSSVVYQNPSTGNVGIGTTSPTQKLQVNGSIAALGSPTAQVQVRGTASSGRFGEDSNGVFISSDTSGKALRFMTTNPNTGVLTEQMRITANGRIGIFTSNPGRTFVMMLPKVSSSAAVFLGDVGCVGTAGISFVPSDDCGPPAMYGDGLATIINRAPLGYIEFREGGIPQMRIASGGNVGVGTGTTSPSNILTIAQSSTTDPIADAWTVYSSKRWKTNVKPIRGALQKVARLQGVSYDSKDSGKHQIGLIGEDVGKVVPEVVAYEKNGVDAQGLDYARLTALLVEAVKQQQRQIRGLRVEVTRLKAHVNDSR